MFCVRGFGGGLGFLSFLGGCSGLSVVFSRASGVSWFLACSAPDCWGGWRVAGGSGVRGLARLFPALLFVGGGFGGASARARFLASSLLGGAGSGARVARFPLCGGGRVVPGFLFVFAVLLSCSRGVFGCCFFPSGALCFLLVSGVGLRGLAGGGGLWGVSGWVRGFFLRLLLYWPGPVWVWVGFCLESLILAQDERWRRA